MRYLTFLNSKTLKKRLPFYILLTLVFIIIIGAFVTHHTYFSLPLRSILAWIYCSVVASVSLLYLILMGIGIWIAIEFKRVDATLSFIGILIIISILWTVANVAIIHHYHILTYLKIP